MSKHSLGKSISVSTHHCFWISCAQDVPKRVDKPQHDGNVGTVIEIVTSVVIKAPIDTVFDLARDVRIHAQATAWTSERVIECTTDGLLEEGDVVTFEARHLGVRQR